MVEFWFRKNNHGKVLVRDKNIGITLGQVIKHQVRIQSGKNLIIPSKFGHFPPIRYVPGFYDNP
ncbi:MAG: hypothetical protein AAFY76_10305, partial [Cyanobacteria bacterium J06649_11]